MATKGGIASNQRRRRPSKSKYSLVSQKIKIPFSFLQLVLQVAVGILLIKSHVEARTDLYQTLNVPKSATSKDITKAYRKLALKHHPDKVSASEREEAEKKFKEIGYAHDVLTDEEKRKRYDMYGEQGLDDSFIPGFSNMNMGGGNGFGSGSGGGNPFSGFGGGAGGTPFGGQSFSQQRFGGGGGGADFGGIDLNDILQQFLGGQQPGGRMHRNGMGMGGMNGFNGMGGFGGMDGGGYNARGGHTRQRHHQHQQQQLKPQTKEFYCSLAELSDFNGCIKKLKVSLPTGTVDPMTGEEEMVEKIYTIDVQPGWKDGTKVRFKASRDGIFPPMTFILRERRHKYITRDGDDLVYKCTVTSRQAERGAKLRIPLPDGDTLELETKPDEIYESYIKRFHGKGMPIRSGSKTTYQRLRGDFRIEFRIRENASTSQSKSRH